jgi:hypothetical protein
MLSCETFSLSMAFHFLVCDVLQWGSVCHTFYNFVLCFLFCPFPLPPSLPAPVNDRNYCKSRVNVNK